MIPRRVLMIHEDESDRRDIEGLAVVLDYFGYIPVYQDIHQPLPPFRLLNRYRQNPSKLKVSRGELMSTGLERNISPLSDYSRCLVLMQMQNGWKTDYWLS